MVTSVGAKKQLSTAKPLVKDFNFYKSGHVFYTVKSCNGYNGSRCYMSSLKYYHQCRNLKHPYVIKLSQGMVLYRKQAVDAQLVWMGAATMLQQHCQ